MGQAPEQEHQNKVFGLATRDTSGVLSPFHVGVVGLGGLGHVAIKFAKAMGLNLVLFFLLTNFVTIVAFNYVYLQFVGLNLVS